MKSVNIKKQIKSGDKLPNVVLRTLSENGLKDSNTDNLFLGKKVVLFGLPGAFTPVCSAQHLPGFVHFRKLFHDYNYEVACLSVNDPFVMEAWMRAQNAKGIVSLADGNGDFTRTIGMDKDYTAFGYGVRSKRFALVAENGIVKEVFVEKSGEFIVSSAEAMLEVLHISIPKEYTHERPNPCRN